MTFPPELCQRPQWLVWKYVTEPGRPKPLKVPHYVNGRKRTGTQGSDEDRANLVTCHVATDYAQANGYDGVGFAFLPGDGLIGIDLDGCFNTDDTERHNRAVKIIQACNSYTELSPSGNGVHIIVKGDTKTFKSNQLGIEVFCGRQFFTMTGRQRAGSPDGVNTITPEVLEKLRNTVQAKAGKPKPAPQPQRFMSEPNASKVAEALSFISADVGYDEWIRIGMAIHSELGDAGESLWDHWSAGGSKYCGPDDIRSHWRSFKPGPITIGTVYGMAKDAGWRPPRASAPPSMPAMPRFNPETGEVLADEPAPAPDENELLIIDPKDPLEVAAEYVNRRHRSDTGFITLQYWRSDWYVWNGVHYHSVHEDWIRSEVYQWLASTFQYVKMMPERTRPNAKLVSEVYQALKAKRLISVDEPPTWITRPDDSAQASDIIACWNGFLRISTRKLEKARPELFVTAALDFDAKENPPKPVEWLRFLDQVWPEDYETQNTLAEAIGYMLTDATDQQKAFMICGPKRSGKGTILRIIESLVGQNNKVSPSFSSLGGQFGLWPLIGKRVAMISDARLSHRSDQAAISENILRITGEDSVSIDRKYKDAWNGKLPTKFLIATNELPSFSDASAALASRFIIFKTNQSFIGKEDFTLTERLRGELPGILMWALDGLERMRRRGRLQQPEAGAQLAQELEEMTSPIGQFIADECVIKDVAHITVKALYDAWRQWCADQGRDHPGSVQNFGKQLTASEPSVQKGFRRVNGKLLRVYEGIRTRTIDDP
jgi:putative DNA primase/helicase